MRLLIKAGADPNGLPPEKSTPLSDAVLRRNQQNADLLLNAGANVNAFVNQQRQTVLFQASTRSTWNCNNSNNEMLRHLIKTGAHMNIKDTFGQTPLSFGAYKPDIEKIKILMEAGADVNDADNDGNTVLHIIARRDTDGSVSRIRSVKFFLKSGCFINKTNDMGRNALGEHMQRLL